MLLPTFNFTHEMWSCGLGTGVNSHKITDIM